MRLEKISPGKREESRDSFQYPLGVCRLPEGYKCLGGIFKFLILLHSPDFLFFVTDFLE